MEGADLLVHHIVGSVALAQAGNTLGGIGIPYPYLDSHTIPTN